MKPVMMAAARRGGAHLAANRVQRSWSGVHDYGGRQVTGLIELLGIGLGAFAFGLLTLASIGIWSYGFVDISQSAIRPAAKTLLDALMIVAAPIGLMAWIFLIGKQSRPHRLIIKGLAGVAAVYIAIVVAVPFFFRDLGLGVSTLFSFGYYAVGLIPALSIAGTRILLERRSKRRSLSTSVPAPAIWYWVLAFSVLMALVGLAGTVLVVLGVNGLLGSLFRIGHDSASLGTAATFMVFTLGAVVLYGIVPVFGVRTWTWTYVTVVLGLSMLTCMLPAAVALIVFWLRDDCRRWVASAGRLRGSVAA